jgi:hypothetical protein
MDKHTPRLRLICVNPPATSDSIEFGLQDKNQQLQFGEAQDNTLTFDFELTVTQEADGRPNFSGTFAHGTKQDRFLYLALRRIQSGDWQNIKRIKIPLKSITWQQIEDVINSPDKRLTASVSGQGAAMVALLGAGWSVVNLQ